MITPQKAVVRVCQSIPKVSLAAFLATFFSGLLIHMYRLCNMALVVETPYFFYSENNRSDHGRWFLHVITNLTSWQDMPYLNGCVTLLYLALGAALLTLLFQVRSRVTAVLIGVVVAANPATAALLHFSYLGDGFAMSFLLSVAAVLIVEKQIDRSGWRIVLAVAGGAMLLCLSMAIYQTNVDTAVVLCILVLLQGIFARKARSVRRFVRLLLMGGCGAGLYMAVTKVVFAVTGVTATEHVGLNTMGQLDLAASWKRLVWLYTDPGHPYMNLLTYPTSPVWQFVGWLGLLCLGGIMAMHLYTSGVYKDPPALVCSLGLLAVLPLATWFLTVLQPQSGGRNALQGNSTMMVWAALIIFAEKMGRDGRFLKAKTLLEWGAWLCTAALTIHFTIFSNQVYMAAHVAFEKDLAAADRLLARMEQTEGYALDAAVCIGGVTIPYSEQGDYTEHTKKLENYFPAVQPRTALYGETSFLRFMNVFLSTDFVPADNEIKQVILESEEYAAMPVWPADGCVRMIDGTLVVRLWQ